MKKVLILLVLSFLFVGCTDKNKFDVKDVLDTSKYIIIDVRTEDEFNEGHVTGAINIPYDEIDEDTELDKDKTIVVYCKSGNRSGIAYNVLSNLGYEAYNLGAFSEIGLPKE